MNNIITTIFPELFTYNHGHLVATWATVLPSSSHSYVRAFLPDDLDSITATILHSCRVIRKVRSSVGSEVQW